MYDAACILGSHKDPSGSPLARGQSRQTNRRTPSTGGRARSRRDRLRYAPSKINGSRSPDHAQVEELANAARCSTNTPCRQAPKGSTTPRGAGQRATRQRPRIKDSIASRSWINLCDRATEFSAHCVKLVNCHVRPVAKIFFFANSTICICSPTEANSQFGVVDSATRLAP